MFKSKYAKSIFFLLLILTFHNLLAQNDLSKAKKLYSHGELRSAIELLESMDGKCDIVEVKSILTKAYAKLENWKAASKQAEFLIALEPKNAEYHFRYGAALGMMAKNTNKLAALIMLDDILFHLKKATRLDPEHTYSRWSLIKIYLELPAIIGGTKSKALKYAQQLVKIDPVEGNLAKAYIERSEANPGSAEDHLNRAIQLSQSTASSWVIKFARVAKLTRSDQQTAIRYIEAFDLTSISQKRLKRLFLLRGQLHQQIGEEKKAIFYLNQSLAIDEGYQPARKALLALNN